MGTTQRTLERWKKLHPSIVSSLKKGKAPVDLEVENALLKSALGYVQTVKKPIKVKRIRTLKGTGTIEEEEIKYVDEEVYIAPNITAQIFWLKNRRPHIWREKQAETPPAAEMQQPDDALTAALREEAARIEAGEE